MIASALDAFTKMEMTHIIKLIEGPAAETMKNQLRGQFDIIFIDADKPGYKNYLQIILDKRLLAKDGIIFTDNSMCLRYTLTLVLSRGLTVDDSEANPYHVEGGGRRVNAQAMKEFNDYVANEPRIEVVVLPLFDGMGLIRLKD